MNNLTNGRLLAGKRSGSGAHLVFRLYMFLQLLKLEAKLPRPTIKCLKEYDERYGFNELREHTR